MASGEALCGPELEKRGLSPITLIFSALRVGVAVNSRLAKAIWRRIYVFCVDRIERRKAPSSINVEEAGIFS